MDQTSQKIIDTAMELMMEIGYTAATTKDIARRAGINEGTIFRRFGEKKEIVLQVMKQSRWHLDLSPEDFSTWSGNLEEDLSRFAHAETLAMMFLSLNFGFVSLKRNCLG